MLMMLRSKYFNYARQMIDIADCRDLASLQAMVLSIMFLQCTARLSRCYSYFGVVITLALRMGLHRSLSVGLDPVKSEARCRIFWSIRNMEARMSSLLGFPRLLHEGDIDQEMPTDAIEDVKQSSFSTLSSAYTRLTHIMTKIVKHVYPIKSKRVSNSTSIKYLASCVQIQQIEHELDEWKLSLPSHFIMDTLSENTPR